MRDGIAFARLGRPVVALVTTKFEDEAHFVARAAGMPGVPLIFLPHPVAGRDHQHRRKVAADIATDVVNALGGRPGEGR